MPEIFENNEFWRRGGHLNQTRHIDMTEEEKTDVIRCDGMKHGHKCKNPVFRCTVCGNYGCAQEVADKCSKQGFKNDKCLQCGTVGSRVPVMENEYDHVVSGWKSNDA